MHHRYYATVGSSARHPTATATLAPKRCVASIASALSALQGPFNDNNPVDDDDDDKMSLTCEISGEAIAGTKDAVVVTPSGHICLKRLLLTKLAENGGVDPFETGGRPLSADQLIQLQGTKDSVVAPRPGVTSFPNLLQTIQAEYDALVLELFDTRKALEETRQELSQALYQNDAAVRVVARLSVERDTARRELEQWSASVPSASSSAPATAEATVEEPSAKRRKVEEVELPLTNDLPEQDLNSMLDVWKQLNSQRKPTLKAAAAKAPTPDTLSKYAEKDSQAWHKTTCRSLSCISSFEDLIVTAGKDKQVILYSTTEKVVKHSWNFGSVPTSLDIFQSVIVASDDKGKIAAYSVADGSTISEAKLKQTKIVQVKIHPTSEHVCVTTASGKLLVLRLQQLEAAAEFSGDEAVEYTCGEVHPDGLLFAAGTTTGKVHIWDFKNKVLASVLQDGDSDDDKVTTIVFSNNGYHLATGHGSGTARFWDLRKQKTIATMNGDGSLLKSLSCLAFDASGKYAAMGGDGGLVVTTVKEWGTTASITTKEGIVGLVWTGSDLASCSKKGRAVSFYGAAE